MSVHIGAKDGEIAETVLLPGDPLRAKFVAETFFSSAVEYSAIRGMLGYTGFWNDRRVSVQGSGMGMPSMAIYVNELIRSYGVRRVIRIGSCGALQAKVHVRDIVLAMGASSDSAMNRGRFGGKEYAPTATWSLLRRAAALAEERGVRHHVGGILSSDSFYQDDADGWRLWARFGALAVEMETNQLYTLAALHGVEALALLTVSDSLVDKTELSAAERERSFTDMIEIALRLA